jgi:hypothetical protein
MFTVEIFLDNINKSNLIHENIKKRLNSEMSVFSSTVEKLKN